MEDIHVGVSGINAADNPGPGVGIARSLKFARMWGDEVFDGQRPGNLPSIAAGGVRVQQDFLPETCGIINFWTRVGWQRMKDWES